MPGWPACAKLPTVPNSFLIPSEIDGYWNFEMFKAPDHQNRWAVAMSELIKQLQQQVGAINDLEPRFKELSDDALLAMTEGNCRQRHRDGATLERIAARGVCCRAPRPRYEPWGCVTTTPS